MIALTPQLGRLLWFVPRFRALTLVFNSICTWQMCELGAYFYA
jgi:hypothetical protein